MLWALVGILLGILAGLSSSATIPLEYTHYTAVVIIGLLDALFGSIRAEVTRDRYSVMIFLTGLLFNILLAIGITLLGDKLGLDLYLAATVVFTFRIFTNVGATRRALIERWIARKKDEQALQEMEGLQI